MSVVRVLYIGGWGRSGSTLLDRMLGQVPSVISLGEVRELWMRGLVENGHCGCGEAFIECVFWREVGDRAFGGWRRAPVDELLRLRYSVDRGWTLPQLLWPSPWPRFRRRFRALAEVLSCLYEAIGEVSGAELLVDSSKLPTYAALLHRVPTIDLRLIHLVRDSRGVAFSWQKVVKRWNGPGAAGAGSDSTGRDPNEMARYGIVGAAARYDFYNAATTALTILGVPSQRVRYEDLMADPVPTLRSVLNHAGLSPAREALSFVSPDAVTLGPGHLVEGNPMRFVHGAIELRNDDGWRHGLPRGRRLAVTAMTSPLLAAYGYL